MKKKIAVLLSVCIVLNIFAMGAVAYSAEEYETSDNTIKVTLNGEELLFPQSPVMIDDRVLVPVREIFEALGADVDWDDSTQSVTSTKGLTTINLTIDSNIMYKNGAEIYLEVPAQLINDKTMVPVRAVSEAFGCHVDWDETNNTVLISVAKIYYGVGKNDYFTYEHGLDYYVENVDSSEYSPELALMLMDLSWSASNLSGDGNQPVDTDEEKRNTVVYKSFESLGFQDIELNEYYNDPNDARYGSDNCAYTIGHKSLSEGGNLITVAVRGSFGYIFSSPTPSDWISNFDCYVSNGGNHTGFETAAQKVSDGIDKYINKYGLTDNVLIITGHSRGAGVGNLTAVNILNNGVEESRLFSYNFACPDTTVSPKNYTNIFNICNKNDIVTLVPRVANENEQLMNMLLLFLQSVGKNDMQKNIDSAKNNKWYKNGITLWYQANSLGVDHNPNALMIDLETHAQSEYHRHLATYPEKETYKIEQ